MQYLKSKGNLLAGNSSLASFIAASVTALSVSASVFAAEEAPGVSEQMRKCMETSVLRADETMTVKSLKEACQLLLIQPGNSTASMNNDSSETKSASDKKIEIDHEDLTNGDKPATNAQAPSESAPELQSIQVASKNKVDPAPESRLLKDRLTIEALNRSNRFVLTPNKRNFLMPASYTNKPNTSPYLESIAANDSEVDSAFTDLKHTEAELQLSVKILIRENIFDDNGHLYLGYTNHALWQVYNRKISAPFRESDHQPELILSFNNDWEIFGFRNVLNDFTLNHQSNGQTGSLSRSWNRVMFTSVFEKDNFAFAINPWYRLPEKEAKYKGDPKGDDNPDIEHYMGNFQLTSAYKYKSNIFSAEIRNNMESDNRGAVELGWTFPVSATMRGYVNYFDGYGHSLIDYNVKQQVVGLGIIFTDLF